jgi:GntR family transcriptional regulator
VSKMTTELQRPVPLYMQVVRQLRAQIASGELTEGGRIPSQREMMQRWRISMQTASKVIGALKTEGLAIPSVGRDTIVAPGAAARIAAASESAYRAPAEPPPASGLDVQATATSTAAPAPVAAILGIPAGRRALRRRETYLHDGQAIRVTDAWFPPIITEQAPRLADNQPLPGGALAYIAEVTGTQAATVIEENSAVAADKYTATALDVPASSAVLATRTRYHTANGETIAYTATWTVAERPHTRIYTTTSS